MIREGDTVNAGVLLFILIRQGWFFVVVSLKTNIIGIPYSLSCTVVLELFVDQYISLNEEIYKIIFTCTLSKKTSTVRCYA